MYMKMFYQQLKKQFGSYKVNCHHEENENYDSSIFIRIKQIENNLNSTTR